jgi:ABC-2 type transport system ATP-binding protein
VAGVDLVVGPGEIYGLVGPNGAGKTTTMKILATLLAPTAGEAFVTGIPVDADPLEVRRRIGYMPDFGSTSTSSPAATAFRRIDGRR